MKGLKKYSFIGAGLIAAVLVGMVFLNSKEPLPQQLKDGFFDIKKSIFWSKEKEPIEKYGIDIGELYVCTYEIKPNESLGEILGENGIPQEVVQELVEKSSSAPTTPSTRSRILSMSRIRSTMSSGKSAIP